MGTRNDGPQTHERWCPQAQISNRTALKNTQVAKTPGAKIPIARTSRCRPSREIVSPNSQSDANASKIRQAPLRGRTQFDKDVSLRVRGSKMTKNDKMRLEADSGQVTACT
jgi:hypothetical protein